MTEPSNSAGRFVPYQLLDKPMYHMCEKHAWEQAMQAGRAYFPPTFEQDGNITHASMTPSTLVETVNHFYGSTDKTVQWVCVELDPTAMRNELGIVTLVEPPKAVGTTDAEDFVEAAVRYPHIYGGISTVHSSIVTNVFPIIRNADTGEFLDIPGLSE